MSKQMTKAFFLQELELAVLLAINGQTELFGLRLEQADTMNEQTLYQTIFHMIKQGLLEKEEDGFSIPKEVQNLMQDVMMAKRFLFLAARDEDKPESYIYVGRSAVCIQPIGQQGNMLRIETMPVEQLRDYVMSHGFGMEQILTMEQPSEQDKLEEIPDYPDSLHEYWQDSKDVILKNEYVSSLLSIYDLASRAKQHQYLIISYQLEDYLVYGNEEKEEIYLYTRQKVEDILKGEFT